jgi:hypothetical protein
MHHTFLRRKLLPRARFGVLDQNVWHGSFQLRIRALCGSQRTGFARGQLIQHRAPALAHESGAQTRHTRAGTLARKPPHACEQMYVRALADVDGKEQRRMRGKRAEVAEKLHEKAWPAPAGSQGSGLGNAGSSMRVAARAT